MSRHIFELVRDDVDDFAFALNAAFNGYHASGQDKAALLLEQVRPAHDVRDTRFILNRHEQDTFGRTRP